MRWLQGSIPRQGRLGGHSWGVALLNWVCTLGLMWTHTQVVWCHGLLVPDWETLAGPQETSVGKWQELGDQWVESWEGPVNRWGASGQGIRQVGGARSPRATVRPRSMGWGDPC